MKRQAGLTLVELLIAITIVGVLAAVAVPNYQTYIKKARRADAQSALLGLSNAMERYFTLNNTYSDVSLGASGIFPNQAPIDGTTKYYTLTVTSGVTAYCSDVTVSTSTAYCLVATPITSSAQDGDGSLSLSSTGARGWDKNSDGDTSDSGENCWETSCS